MSTPARSPSGRNATSGKRLRKYSSTVIGLGRRRRHNPAWIWVFLVLLAHRGCAISPSIAVSRGMRRAHAPFLVDLADLLRQKLIDGLRPRAFQKLPRHRAATTADDSSPPRRAAAAGCRRSRQARRPAACSAAPRRSSSSGPSAKTYSLLKHWRASAQQNPSTLSSASSGASAARSSTAARTEVKNHSSARVANRRGRRARQAASGHRRWRPIHAAPSSSSAGTSLGHAAAARATPSPSAGLTLSSVATVSAKFSASSRNQLQRPREARGRLLEPALRHQHDAEILVRLGKIRLQRHRPLERGRRRVRTAGRRQRLAQAVMADGDVGPDLGCLARNAPRPRRTGRAAWR